MSINTQSESYTKGLELAEQGNHDEALVCFQQHLVDQPNDAEALSDAGAVLYCLGKTEQAIEHFKKAVIADNDYCQSYWNLSEAYLTEGKPLKAVELFNDMQRLEILNPEQTIRTANVFLEQSDKGSAIEMMLKSIELSESEEIVKPMIDVIKGKRPKIAFFGISENNSFYDYVSERFMTESFKLMKPDELPDLINWCDVAWFEGAGDDLTRALALPKVCKIAVNLNSADQGDLDTEKIDKLISDTTTDNSDFNSVLLELEDAYYLEN